MTPRAQAPNSPRKPRKHRKLDPDTVLEQQKRGLTHQEIADLNGVNQSTIWRFLQYTKPEEQALAQFKTHRADILARLQAKSIDAQERIIETLKDGVLKTLEPHQKAGLLMALNAVHGTSFDKERLTLGLSTENHSVISKLLDARVQARYKPVPDKPRRQHDPHVSKTNEDGSVALVTRPTTDRGAEDVPREG